MPTRRFPSRSAVTISYVTVGLECRRAGWPAAAGGIAGIGACRPSCWPSGRREPTTAPKRSRFTTVASWRSGYGPRGDRRPHGGPEAHQFRRVVDSPSGSKGARFEIALDIHAGDAADLDGAARPRLDGRRPARGRGDPRDVPRLVVARSTAEFSVAQGVYVETACGWFSDRTAAYLASGRPALVQDTGVADLPLGEGLLTFSSPAEDGGRRRRIAADPAAHGDAARAPRRGPPRLRCSSRPTVGDDWDRRLPEGLAA